MNFLPDWHEMWTVEEALSELRDFYWIGPGIYLQGEDSLLVYPIERDPQSVSFWGSIREAEEKFQFLFYNGRNVGAIVNSFHPLVPTRSVRS